MCKEIEERLGAKILALGRIVCVQGKLEGSLGYRPRPCLRKIN